MSYRREVLLLSEEIRGWDEVKDKFRGSEKIPRDGIRYWRKVSRQGGDFKGWDEVQERVRGCVTRRRRFQGIG